MKRSMVFSYLFLLALLVTVDNICAQNHSLEEKFRLQYKQLHWMQYRSNKYTVYFNKESDSLAKYVIENTSNYIKNLEDSLQFGFKSKLNIIIYNGEIDQAQSNIGLYGEDVNRIGVIPFRGNRILLSYKGNRTEFLNQLKIQLGQLLLTENFYGSTIEEVRKRLLKEPLDTWFMEGATQYLANRWSEKKDDDLKQILLIPKAKTFSDVAMKNPALMGQAFFYYIEHEFGSRNVYRFIFQVRMQNDIAKACRLTFKQPLWKMQENCSLFYVNRYLQDNTHSKGIDSSKIFDFVALNMKRSLIPKESVVVHPSGTHLAYIKKTEKWNEVLLRNLKAKKEELLFRYKNDGEVDTYTILSWNIRDSKELALVYSMNGELMMRIFTFNSKYILVKTQSFSLDNIDGIQSVNFGSTSRILLLSGFKNGQTDLFTFNTISKTLTELTDNYYDENNATPFSDGNQNGILFTSNSPADTFFHKNIEWPKLSYEKLFYITDETFGKIASNKIGTYFAISLPNPDSADISCIRQGKGNSIYYLSSKNGIANEYMTKLSHNHFERPVQITNLNSSITGYSLIDSNRVIYTTQFLDSLFVISANDTSAESKKAETEFAKEDRQRREALNIRATNGKSSVSEQSLFHPFQADSAEVSKYKDSILSEKTFNANNVKKYQLQLTSDYVSVQLDNSLLVNKYQPYQLNQGQFHQQVIGGIAKYTFSDIFEDHKTTIGIRIPSTTKGSDFFFEYDNYKHRLDWGVSYMRHVEKFFLRNDTTWINQSFLIPSYVKQKTHYGEIRIQYPFSTRKAVRMSLGIRYDRQVFIATDTYSLTYPDTTQLWTIARIEYIQNQVRLSTWDAKKGFYIKAFYEYFAQLGSGKGSFMHIGGQMRYYQPIYKQMLWANRLQVATSGGESEGIMYVLGGVQNQLSPRVDSNVHFSPNQYYSFMSYSGDLRGYAQNIRTGNTLVLCNSEMRVPILPLFFNHKTALNSLNTLQMVLFTDVGNAWKLGSVVPSWTIGYGAGIRTELVGYFVRIDLALRAINEPGFKNPLFHIAIGRDW